MSFLDASLPLWKKLHLKTCLLALKGMFTNIKPSWVWKQNLQACIFLSAGKENETPVRVNSVPTQATPGQSPGSTDADLGLRTMTMDLMSCH